MARGFSHPTKVGAGGNQVWSSYFHVSLNLPEGILGCYDVTKNVHHIVVNPFPGLP